MAVPPNGSRRECEHPTQGDEVLVPSCRTSMGPTLHQGHQNLLFLVVKTNISIQKSCRGKGKKSQAQPRRSPAQPPLLTATGSQLLRGFFVLDNKNKTLLSGSYKNPTEKLSPSSKWSLRNVFVSLAFSCAKASRTMNSARPHGSNPFPTHSLYAQGTQPGQGGKGAGMALGGTPAPHSSGQEMEPDRQAAWLAWDLNPFTSVYFLLCC